MRLLDTIRDYVMLDRIEREAKATLLRYFEMPRMEPKVAEELVEILSNKGEEYLHHLVDGKNAFSEDNLLHVAGTGEGNHWQRIKDYFIGYQI